MRLSRTLVLLVPALLVLLVVVMLRSETARLHYDLSQLDQRADSLLGELRELDLELARQRSPAAIRARAEYWRLRALGLDGLAARVEAP
jgi:hypothetical protein